MATNPMVLKVGKSPGRRRPASNGAGEEVPCAEMLPLVKDALVSLHAHVGRASQEGQLQRNWSWRNCQGSETQMEKLHSWIGGVEWSQSGVFVLKQRDNELMEATRNNDASAIQRRNLRIMTELNKDHYRSPSIWFTTSTTASAF